MHSTTARKENRPGESVSGCAKYLLKVREGTLSRRERENVYTYKEQEKLTCHQLKPTDWLFVRVCVRERDTQRHSQQRGERVCVFLFYTDSERRWGFYSHPVLYTYLSRSYFPPLSLSHSLERFHGVSVWNYPWKKPKRTIRYQMLSSSQTVVAVDVRVYLRVCHVQNDVLTKKQKYWKIERRVYFVSTNQATKSQVSYCDSHLTMF